MVYARRNKKPTYVRRRKFKKTYKKKTSLKKSRNYGSGQGVISTLRRPLLGFKKTMSMIYAEQDIQINPGIAGIAASYVFSANGLYDPNITSTGHQPNGFDQIMLMYNHYTVIGCKITVRFHNTDTTLHQQIGIYKSATTSTESDPRVIIENGMGVYSIITPLASGHIHNTATLTDKMSIGKFMGRRNILSEDDFRGNSSSNPVEQAYFHVWCGPTTASDASAIGLMVRLEYIVVFTEPKTLALS